MKLSYEHSYVKLTKILGYNPIYIQCPITNRSRIFFVKDIENIKLIIGHTLTANQKFELCDYIWDSHSSDWIKYRKEITALTETETLLYAET